MKKIKMKYRMSGSSWPILTSSRLATSGACRLFLLSACTCIPSSLCMHLHSKASSFPLFLLDVPHHSVFPFRVSPLCANFLRTKRLLLLLPPGGKSPHFFTPSHTVRDLPAHWVCQVPSPLCPRRSQAEGMFPGAAEATSRP